MGKKHKLQMSQWQGNILKRVERIFEKYEEALQHLFLSDCESGKIYGPDGELVHSGPGGTRRHTVHDARDRHHHEDDSYA